jgi:hypothetical protein
VGEQLMSSGDGFATVTRSSAYLPRACTVRFR